MNNETKRDVFDETLSNLKKMDAQIEGEWGYSQLTMGVGKHGDVESIREIAIAEIRDRYAAASPCKLPVIPKAVGEYIKWGKTFDIPMYMMFSFKFVRRQEFSKFTDEVEDWIISNSDAFAIAWVLGVWRVSETGEIVKLEEEK